MIKRYSDHAANERTFLAWVRTGVAVIAFSGVSGFKLDPRALIVLSAALAQSLYFVGQKPLLSRYRAIEFTTYAESYATLLIKDAVYREVVPSFLIFGFVRRFACCS